MSVLNRVYRYALKMTSMLVSVVIFAQTLWGGGESNILEYEEVKTRWREEKTGSRS